jgi:hypothetical protein
MSSVRSRTPEEVWFGAAVEVARLPREVTADMQRQHQCGRDGNCAGMHGVHLVRWPCSTWRLALAADRMRP